MPVTAGSDGVGRGAPVMTPNRASVSPVAQKDECPAFSFWVAAIKPSARGLEGCVPHLPQVKPPGAAGRALPVPSVTSETCPSQKCSSRSIPSGMCCKTTAVAEFCTSAGREEGNLMGNKISSLPWSLRVLAGSGAAGDLTHSTFCSASASLICFLSHFPANKVLFRTFLFQVILFKSLYSGWELPVPGSLSLRARQTKSPDPSRVVTPLT